MAKPSKMKWAVERMRCSSCGSEHYSVHPHDLERVECTCGAWTETALGRRLGGTLEHRLKGRTN